MDDTLDPEERRSSGVNHKNLLWVRVAKSEVAQEHTDSAPASLPGICQHRQARWSAGIAEAIIHEPRRRVLMLRLGKMLTQKSEARLEKMEGTPGTLIAN